MSYLLDTNACIALIKGRPLAVRRRLDAALRAGEAVAVPAVAAFELWYGVANGAPEHRLGNVERLMDFLTGPLAPLPFDTEDARHAGGLRSELRRAGTPIGGYDLLIAGQALARGLTVVTSNTREFGRVAGLAREDWAAP